MSGDYQPGACPCCGRPTEAVYTYRSGAGPVACEHCYCIQEYGSTATKPQVRCCKCGDRQAVGTEYSLAGPVRIQIG